MTAERDSFARTIERPSVGRIQALAASEHMHLDEADARDIGALVDATLAEVERLDRFDVPPIPVRYAEGRDAGRRPTPEEDPYNAFIRFCRVEGSGKGPLVGKRVGLKDNMRLAGVPMTNASRLMNGYVPTLDATVAERVLDAGATIVGKLNMDNFSMGGTSETGDYGAVRNPRNPSHSAGGSSGGSGAALAAGQVDIAFGVDQAGSARIPASWCGVASLKATQGLISNFGISYLDHSIDSVCPMTRTVEDLALTLEAVAGADPKDPQWIRGAVSTTPYVAALREPIEGLRIGIVSESMTWPDSEADVNAAVRASAQSLTAHDASVRDVSVPWWQDCGAILFGLLAPSFSAMIESDLEGYWRGGLCDPGWQEAFAKVRRSDSDAFPTRLKVLMLLGKYLRVDLHGVHYSRAQNARVAIADHLDRLFREVDILVTPTVHFKATRLVEETRAGSWEGRGAVESNKNCCPLNLTGHPAVTVPCGIGEHGLPIGIQLVGRRWEEARLLAVAARIKAPDFPAPNVLSVDRAP